MKFTTNTKPFAEALELGIINSNISNFHKKSTIVQLTANKDELCVNIESAMICTELKLKGFSEDGDHASIFVSSSMLKQLVNTFDSSTIGIEFTEGGLILHSGKSKFTLPKLIDADDIDLQKPADTYDSMNQIEIKKENWKFIKDNQMYAIAMSFIHPVYTRVWVGASNDVLVGDFDNSLFTHSTKGNLGSTCLLSDTIINLFNSLPEGAKLIRLDREYIIKYESDSFSYVTQFTPLYEDSEDVGSYQSEIFLDIMSHPDSYMKVSSASVSKFLSQASMLASSIEDSIKTSVEGSVMSLVDNSVDCNMDVECIGIDPDFSVEFKTETLHKVFSNYNGEDVFFSPIMQDEEVGGILIWDNNLTTMVAGVE